MAKDVKSKVGKTPGGENAEPEVKPALRKVIDKVTPLVKEAHRGDPARLYSIGEYMIALSDVPKYGKDAEKRLMTELGWAKETLVNAKRLAAYYAADEFKALCELETKSGGFVSSRHFVCASYENDPAKRIKWIKQAAKEGWSAADLEKEIQRSRPAEKKSKAGRRLKTAEDLDGLLRQQENETGKWLKRNEEVWSEASRTLVRFAEVVPDGAAVTEQLKSLERLEKNFDRLLAAAKQRLADCRAAMELLKAKAPEGEEAAGGEPVQASDAADDAQKSTVGNDPEKPDKDSGEVSASKER